MKRFFISQWTHMFLLFCILASLFHIRTIDASWINGLRNLAFDTYNRIKPRIATHDVVVVDIDEASLKELGQWPWPRDMLAGIVENLNEMGAHSIVFDMVFAEKDRSSPDILKDKITIDKDNLELMNLLTVLPNNDLIFADTIREAGNVVTGFIFTNDSNASSTPPTQKGTFWSDKPDITSQLYKKASAFRYSAQNLPELASAAAGNGLFGVVPDPDGIIRHIPLVFIHNDEQANQRRAYPSLAIEGLRVAQLHAGEMAAGEEKNIFVVPAEDYESNPYTSPLSLKIGKYSVPSDWDGVFNIYFSKERKDRYISAVDVYKNTVNQGLVRNKIVLIGTSAEGLRDIRSSPIDVFIPGVEALVNVIEQIISQEFLIRPFIFPDLETSVMLSVSALIILLSPYIGVIYLFLFTLTTILALSGASWYSFVIHGLLLDPVYPSLTIFIVFILTMILAYIRTESEKKQIRDAFGLYISPEYMEELTKNPQSLSLGGQTKNLTVMFTDIRSFTTISESLRPEELIQLMNDFLTPMSDLVMLTRGTIDKYMGDAMMAFWNAPLDDPQHARNACRAALEMNKALVPINKALAQRAQEQGVEPLVLKAGIGINTGEASVGNMGSKQRFAYSALGDTVNLASRLEGQTKAYGVEVLIGHGTYERTKEFACLELDLIKVKGKNEPERIYSLLGDEQDAKQNTFKSWKAAHEDMLIRYRKMDFDGALQKIEDCMQLSEGRINEYYEMIKARILDMQKSPPAPDWDGVFVATSK